MNILLANTTLGLTLLAIVCIACYFEWHFAERLWEEFE
jgi:hypothetical protein